MHGYIEFNDVLILFLSKIAATVLLRAAGSGSCYSGCDEMQLFLNAAAS